MEQPEVVIELGIIVVGLAVLSRIAARLAIPTIPFYLAAGLAFGEGGIVPLVTAEEFVEIGAEIGLILLLFMLGLEYTAAELTSTLRAQAPTGLFDLVFNFTPGAAAALLLGFGIVPAIVLGGVTYVSSSGIVAKLLDDLGRLGNRETPSIISVLVTEDLVMAIYLPLIGALLVGGDEVSSLLRAAVAVAVVVLVLLAALRIEVGISQLIFSRSDEALLLTILGVTLLIAGTAELFRVSGAVAALLVGIVVSGPAARGAQALISPLRHLFAALFFAFVGLSLDPAEIPPVVGIAAGLAVVGVATKFATGWFGAKRLGVGTRGRVRAGATLVSRGEFSIAIAGFATAAGLDPSFEALAVTYVFLLAFIGPLLSRAADPIADAWLATRREAAPTAPTP